MEKEMEKFEVAFAEALSSQTLPMGKIMHYVQGVKGKRLRPKLVFLSAKLFGQINDATRRTALFVELLHTATLIHDDVVDGSDVRRGQDSVNGKWGNKTAVLAGDYLLSKAIRLLALPMDHQILREMLDVAMAMSEGELLQLRGERLEVRGESEATKAYLDIITRKTARLIKACCVGGALSVGVSEEALRFMGDFGLNLGLVFQMRDDILDNDNPEITVIAERLLPEYKEKALKALDALTPFVMDQQALSSLQELTVFCAERII